MEKTYEILIQEHNTIAASEIKIENKVLMKIM
jgi:hypothetical protein